MEEIFAVVVELLNKLTLERIEQFFPKGMEQFFPDMKVPNALAYLHVVETLALRNMRGHETTQAALSRATNMPKQTLHRYLSKMEQAGLIYKGGRQGRNYYLDLNRFKTPENAAHLTAKVKAIIGAANQLTEIQNRVLAA